MLDEMAAIADDYLAEGGPLAMLETGIGGPEAERLEYQGRPQYPERLHVTALVLDIITRLLAQLDSFFTETGDETNGWADATDSALTSVTRQRLETIRDRSNTLSHS